MKNFASEVYGKLRERYGVPPVALHFSNTLELLIATMLSAQCTDKRVNIVTETLFQKYKTANDYATSINLADDIKSVNFFRNKALHIKATAQILVEQYGGEVPDAMDGLLKLPGVARKTANVVLVTGFNKIEGIVVDTHVRRISNRLGVSKEDNALKIERDLMSCFEREVWSKIPNLFIALGRDVCTARSPHCELCILSSICPSSRSKSA